MASFYASTLALTAVLLAGCASAPPRQSTAQPQPATAAATGTTNPAERTLAELRQAAESGNLDAQFTLAQVYEVGSHGVPMDLDKAFKWYTVAAEAGYVPAQHFLGGMYASSRGTALNVAKAIYWFRMAADQGYPDSLYPVAYAYENGLGGLAQDNAQALAWYRKAADAGNTFAFQRLAQAYRLGELGLSPDAEQASQYQARMKLGPNERLLSMPVGKQ